MSLVEKLSTLGLQPLLESACEALGRTGGEGAVRAVANLLTRQFVDESRRLERALAWAHERAWKALELALAGDSFWERCRARMASGEDRAFRDQVRAFLDSVPADQLPADRPACLTELRALRKAGLLAPGALDPRKLAEDVGGLARFAEPRQLLQAQKQIAAGMAADLCASGHANLGRLLAVEPGPSLLVVSLRYFLRRAVEADEVLARGLTFAQLEGLHAGQEQGFAVLQQMLAEQGSRVEELLGEVQVLVAETHTAVLDVQQELARQGEQNQALYEAVLEMQRRFDLAQTEVRPRDSLSIRNEAERRMVKDLVARYRGLPEEERQKLPALLNAIGKLEVAAGSFQSAEQDFASVAGLIQDPHAQAEAHHNAYRAALEARDWPTALRELLQALRLDGKRFAPFPVGKYPPLKILGAGGFGVAFLCKHKYMNTRVVVKTLIDDDLDRGIEQLFAEAQVLRQLNHPGIVRVQDCGYTDAASRSRPYLVMDYFEGITLEEHVQKQGPLSPEQLLPVARQTAEALRAAHEKKILHRDVKPANLLVRHEGNRFDAQLIDFGLAMRQAALARSTRRSGTLLGASIAGTLDYAAPEQIGKLQGVAVGPYSDVFGWGKTCCFALFGTTQPVLKHWQSIPGPLADLLGGCLAETPAERPADFTEVLRCLDQLDSCTATAIKPAPPPRPPAEELTAQRGKKGPDSQRSRERVTRPDDFDAGVRVRRRRTREDDWDEDDGDEDEDRPLRPNNIPGWVWGVAGGGVAVLFLLVGLVVALAGRGRKATAETSQAEIQSPQLPEQNPPAVPRPDPGPQPFRVIPPDVQPPRPVPGPGEGEKVYLTDLKEREVRGGLKNLGKHGKIWPGVQKAMVNSKEVPRGLCQAPISIEAASVKYDLGRRYTVLETQAAINDSSPPAPGFVYSVHGDGKELWSASTVTRGNPAECRVDVTGVDVLELRVACGRRGRSGDAVWVDPCVYTGKAPPGDPRGGDPAPTVEVKIPWQGRRVFLSDMAEYDVQAGPWPFWKGGRHGAKGDEQIRVSGRLAPEA
jgi:serine/threonine protein kinase